MGRRGRRLELGRALVVAATLGLGTAAPAAVEVTGVGQVRFEWEPASGPVVAYGVFVSRNGGAEARVARVAEPNALVDGAPGDTIVVRVAAEDAAGARGPFSPASEPVVFLAEPPPPGGNDPPPGGNDPPPGGNDPPPGGNDPPPDPGPDLDGDGRADVVLRDPGNGAPRIYALGPAGLELRGTLPDRSPAWSLDAVGDFDANGVGDLAWSEGDAAQIELWLLDAALLVGGGVIDGPSGQGWQLAHAADFDGDGAADLLLRRPDNGDLELWHMQGTLVAAVERLDGGPDSGWSSAARDFDGDGHADLLWLETGSGRLELWRLDGLSVVEVVPVEAVPPGWQLLGAGDLDGDGMVDALLESPERDGVALRSPFGSEPARELPVPAAARELLAIGDFEGIGREQVLWRDADAAALELWSLDASGGLVRRSLADPVAPACREDLDGDGEIGLPDLQALNACLGRDAEGDCARGDLNGDGRIGLPDWAQLGQRLGVVCGAP